MISYGTSSTLPPLARKRTLTAMHKNGCFAGLLGAPVWETNVLTSPCGDEVGDRPKLVAIINTFPARHYQEFLAVT